MTNLKVTLFDVEVEDEFHTILKMPDSINQDEFNMAEKSCFNLVMIDVSGSMHQYWPPLMEHWNALISPVLQGTTKIFVFGSSVYFRRDESYLINEDFMSEATNLTEAIKTVNFEIKKTDKDFVRLFLITDGHHNASAISPDFEISKLFIPDEKTVEVFLLGAGESFPVEYSISIRSALHNGNANVPSLFWANERTINEDSLIENTNVCIEQQILSMKEIIKMGNLVLNISPPGKLSPGFPDTKVIHLGEFLYFPFPSEKISSSLKISIEDNDLVDLEIITKSVDIVYLLDNVFCQWNSLVIQQHRNKKEVCTETFDVMDKIYNNSHKKLMIEINKISENENSIKSRLTKKNIKKTETQYATLMNQSKKLIGLEEKFSSEIELANSILQTTVKSKYDTKNMKMKGHAISSYMEDINDFTKIYLSIKENVIAIPEPTDDECCRITMTSMIKDLQDPLLPDLLQEDKFTFMKTFTVTGIPIYAPIKDSSQINVWSLCIENILKSPYSIISQRTLEISADANKLCTNSDDKELYLVDGDENSRFNAIVPVITPETAKVLKPLIRTNIFAMLSTFCILKNPHIIDHNAHMAGLGCTWMKLIKDYPLINRPEFVTNIISLVEVTGKLYLDRGGYAKYLDVLLTETNESLMTESDKIETIAGKHLKCESLIKPTFLLYLSRNERKEITHECLLSIFPLLVAEFIGRCLSNFNTASEYCTYSRLFVPELGTKEKRKIWFNDKLEETCSEVLDEFIKKNGKLLPTYFLLENLRKNLKTFCMKFFEQMDESLYEYKINMKTVENLRSPASAGNITLDSLKAFACEMGILEDNIKEIFSEENIFVYVHHGLQHKQSKERMDTPFPSYEVALEKVKTLVAEENNKNFKKLALQKIIEEAENIWTSEFLSVHEAEFVKPMTKEEIMTAISHTGEQVNFDKSFRYNDKSGLLRNACMVKACPFYLKPDRTFNQHINIERKLGYPHQLHKVTLSIALANGDADDVIETLLGGTCGSQCERKVPPLPSADLLESMRKQIERLMADYKQFVGLDENDIV